MAMRVKLDRALCLDRGEVHQDQQNEQSPSQFRGGLAKPISHVDG